MISLELTEPELAVVAVSTTMIIMNPEAPMPADIRESLRTKIVDICDLMLLTPPSVDPLQNTVTMDFSAIEFSFVSLIVSDYVIKNFTPEMLDAFDALADKLGNGLDQAKAELSA